MTIEQVRKDMAFLSGQLAKSLAKWRRAFNRYANNGRRVEDIRNQYGNPLSYFNVEDGEDTGVTPNLNLIRSAIDTHVSKVSQTKVRPFFNPINGTYKTLRTARNTQHFFDLLFDAQAVYPNAVECARFADIFERGCMWIDDEDRKIKRIAPWEFLFDAAEFNYGKITRCMILQKDYPLTYLKEKLTKKMPQDDSGKSDADSLKTALEDNPFYKIERAIYYDLDGQEKFTFAGTVLIERIGIKFTCPPVIMLFAEKPLKGSNSVSMADNIYTVQTQVDSLCLKIHLAYELSPANVTWVMAGTEVKGSMLTNEIGAVYPYKPLAGVTSPPVIIATPPALDPQYLPMLQFWIQQAYEITGISQLSAQAKKPSGLNSGVALQTVEDVESERHNPWLQAFIRFFIDIAKTVIEVFPDSEDILPVLSGRSRIKWSDIKRERDNFSIQFSASSSLSKDPKTKMEQIEKLIAMKVINESLAASLLEFPDLESAYSITAASYDYCQWVIEQAIEHDNFDFLPIANLDQLYGEIVNTILRLAANDENKKTLEKLVKLLNMVKEVQDKLVAAAAQPNPALTPVEPPKVQGPTNALPLTGVPAQPPGLLPSNGNGQMAAVGAPAQGQPPVPPPAQ